MQRAASLAGTFHGTADIEQDVEIEVRFGVVNGDAEADSIFSVAPIFSANTGMRRRLGDRNRCSRSRYR